MNTIKLAYSSDKAKFDLGSLFNELVLPKLHKKWLMPISVLSNLRGHLSHLHLMTHASIRGALAENPGGRYRYLRSTYLAHDFSIEQRLNISLTHHKSVVERFKRGFLKESTTSGHVLWAREVDGISLEICLRSPYYYNFDGDLCLTFRANGEDIYIISFTLSPGNAVGSQEDLVLMVSGIQGIYGRMDMIRKTTELCDDVAPVHMLLAAAEALCLQLQINTIIGFGNKQGLETEQADGKPRYTFNYNDFWRPIVGAEEDAEFYHLPIPFKDKPIESVKAKHRSRALRRREIKAKIREEIILQSNFVLTRFCLK